MTDYRALIREARVRVLLETRLDHLDSVKVQRFGSVPGSEWTTYVRCPDCAVNRRMYGHCGACNGTREVKKSMPAEGLPAPSVPGRESDPVVRQLLRRDKRDSSGSYRELELLLEKLGDEREVLRRVIFYVYDARLAKRDTLPRFEAEAVSWLAERMPARIKVPRRLMAPVREIQLQAIKTLAAEGLKVSAIAKCVGSSKNYIRTVLEA